MGTGREVSSSTSPSSSMLLSSSLSSLSLAPPAPKQRRVHTSEAVCVCVTNKEFEEVEEKHRVRKRPKEKTNDVSVQGDDKFDDDNMSLSDNDMSTSIPMRVSLHKTLADRLSGFPLSSASASLSSSSCLPESLVAKSAEQSRPIYPLVLYRPFTFLGDDRRGEPDDEDDEEQIDENIDEDANDNNKWEAETMDVD